MAPEMTQRKADLTCNRRSSHITGKDAKFGWTSARIRKVLESGKRGPAILLVGGFRGCLYRYPHPFDYIPSRMGAAEKPGLHL